MILNTLVSDLAPRLAAILWISNGALLLAGLTAEPKLKNVSSDDHVIAEILNHKPMFVGDASTFTVTQAE